MKPEARGVARTAGRRTEVAGNARRRLLFGRAAGPPAVPARAEPLHRVTPTGTVMYDEWMTHDPANGGRALTVAGRGETKPGGFATPRGCRSPRRDVAEWFANEPTERPGSNLNSTARARWPTRSCSRSSWVRTARTRPAPFLMRAGRCSSLAHERVRATLLEQGHDACAGCHGRRQRRRPGGPSGSRATPRLCSATATLPISGRGHDRIDTCAFDDVTAANFDDRISISDTDDGATAPIGDASTTPTR